MEGENTMKKSGIALLALVGVAAVYYLLGLASMVGIIDAMLN
jgi:hypothetical protein